MLFENYPTLKNATLILHALTKEDVPYLDLLKADDLVYRYEPTFLPEHKAKNSLNFIEKDIPSLFKNKENIILGVYRVTNPKELIGIAECYDWQPKRNKISLGYRFRSCFWQHGYATQTVALLKDYLLHDCHLTRITAHVMALNEASSKVLLHNGFSQRREVHYENWGWAKPILAYKYVIYLE